MIKHSVLMTVEEYFAIKNYLVELKSQGKLNNDAYMLKFYKAFAIDSSIKLDRNKKLYDNPSSVIIFYLEDDKTLLSTIGLFCREHAIDNKRTNPVLSKALNHLKDYIAAELLDVLGL